MASTATEAPPGGPAVAPDPLTLLRHSIQQLLDVEHKKQADEEKKRRDEKEAEERKHADENALRLSLVTTLFEWIKTFHASSEFKHLYELRPGSLFPNKKIYHGMILYRANEWGTVHDDRYKPEAYRDFSELYILVAGEPCLAYVYGFHGGTSTSRLLFETPSECIQKLINIKYLQALVDYLTSGQVYTFIHKQMMTPPAIEPADSPCS